MAAKTSIAKAYVQIVPTTTGIKDSLTKVFSGAGDSAGKSAGSNIVGTLKKVLAAAGIGKIIASAVTAGGDLQQSIGGVETLYGEAADAIKDYANEAYKYGLSANDYMEQSTSFAAALKQALGGDVMKAAESANTALEDMADNSAKLGTPIESLQMAYQGFAKQNYTMLDNLKIGYGGTKTEMERLLADAEKLTGVKYDISNLSDVYEAIHVIQDDLGLTGTAAKEASTTFTGSMQAMKAAATNLLGKLSLGEDITEEMSALTTSVANFLLNNLLPMVGNVLAQLPTVIVGAVKAVANYADEIIYTGVDLIGQLATGIVTGIPQLILSLVEMANQMLLAISSVDWIGAGNGVIEALKTGWTENVPTIMTAVGELLSTMVTIIQEDLPEFLDQGIEMILNIANGLLENLPTMITALGDVLSEAIAFILENLPQFMEKGVEMIVSLAEGVWANLPEILSAIWDVITQLLGTLADNLPEFLQKGVELVGELASGLINAAGDAVGSMGEVLQEIVDSVPDFIDDMVDAGWDLLMGLKQGITNAVGSVVSAVTGAVSNVVNAAKNFLGIHSPSTVFAGMGKFIDMGLANGINDNLRPVQKAMDDLQDAAVGDFQTKISTSANVSGSSMPTSANTYTFGDIYLTVPENVTDPKEFAKVVIDEIRMITRKEQTVWKTSN